LNFLVGFNRFQTRHILFFRMNLEIMIYFCFKKQSTKKLLRKKSENQENPSQKITSIFFQNSVDFSDWRMVI